MLRRNWPPSEIKALPASQRRWLAQITMWRNDEMELWSNQPVGPDG